MGQELQSVTMVSQDSLKTLVTKILSTFLSRTAELFMPSTRSLPSTMHADQFSKIEDVSNILEKELKRYKKLIKMDDEASYRELLDVDELTVREFLRTR